MRRAAAVVAGLALTACAPSGAAPEKVTATVTIEHSRFAPEVLSFAAGTTVTFVVRNTDPIAHEFILGDRRVQRAHERGTERDHGAVPGEVSVPAGATRSTTYTFARPGTLLIGCHLPGHYAYGMRGRVEVS